jgi:hypothetical protein
MPVCRDIHKRSTAQAHFRQHKPAKTQEQAARQRQQLLASLPEGQRGGVSEALLANAAGLGMVESSALLGNARNNGFIGVNLYTDDEASFIDAPINQRASAIAACCGRPMQVLRCPHWEPQLPVVAWHVWARHCAAMHVVHSVVWPDKFVL